MRPIAVNMLPSTRRRLRLSHPWRRAAASYLGQGNIACYRGPELYDDQSPEVRRLWTLWVTHYKRFRSILSADSVHVRRPSGGGVEATLHVNASAATAEPRGFLNIFNPMDIAVSTRIDLPVYYAGLRRAAAVHMMWGGSLLAPEKWPVPHDSILSVRDDFTVRVSVEMAPRSFVWAAVYSATQLTA